MARLQELSSISSEPLAPKPERMPRFLEGWVLGAELFAMLAQKNGFYALESALHIFPVTSDPASGLEGWNSDSLWRGGYKDLAHGLLFFAEDVFQDQFCLSSQGIMRFCAQTGATEFMAGSMEKWADRILSDSSAETGWQLARDWQAPHWPPPPGKRCMPKMPFIFGGEYSLDNPWAGDPLEGMRLKASLAMQTRGLPDGTKIRLRVTD